jgi:hypothetical protein
MKLSFRKVSSPEAFKKTVDFLTQDVIKHGGSATEIVDMFGALRQLTVCAVPWGTLLINKPISNFEAWVFWIQDIE